MRVQKNLLLFFGKSENNNANREIQLDRSILKVRGFKKCSFRDSPTGKPAVRVC